MSILKIVIADSNQDSSELLARQIRLREDMEIVGISGYGEGVIQLIRAKKPNVLVMNPTLEGSGTLLSYVQQKKNVPHVILYLPMGNRSLLPLATDWDSAVCGGMMSQLLILTNCIRTALEPELDAENDRAISRRVTALLRQFGISPHIRGYHYLRSAIVAVVKDGSLLRGVTKVLYPSIAECCGTSASCVERAIRNAIELSWTRCDIDFLHHHFGAIIDPETGRPTNLEFIATIADILYLQQDRPVSVALPQPSGSAFQYAVH